MRTLKLTPDEAYRLCEAFEEYLDRQREWSSDDRSLWVRLLECRSGAHPKGK